VTLQSEMQKLCCILLEMHSDILPNPAWQVATIQQFIPAVVVLTPPKPFLHCVQLKYFSPCVTVTNQAQLQCEVLPDQQKIDQLLTQQNQSLPKLHSAGRPLTATYNCNNSSHTHSHWPTEGNVVRHPSMIYNPWLLGERESIQPETDPPAKII